MKSKLKWRSILLIGLSVFLASLGVWALTKIDVEGCASAPPVSYSAVPTLTAEQVISRVQVYGVPDDSYYKDWGQPIKGSPRPVGQWAAVYEGDGQWRVQGTVVASTSKSNKLLEYYEALARGENPSRPGEYQPSTSIEESYYSTTWIYREDVKEIKLINFSR